MKRFLIIGSICAAFLASAALTVVAQDDHDRQDDRQAQQQDQHRDQSRDEHRRIDDAHYREHFGRAHHFAIHHVETREGRPFFAYGGYNFEIAQAWPAGWSYNDDCYIEDVDGQYYLYDVRHPGVRVLVTIVP